MTLQTAHRVKPAVMALVLVFISSTLISGAAVTIPGPEPSSDVVDLSVSGLTLASDGQVMEGDVTTLTATVNGDASSGLAWVKRGVVLDVGGAGEGKIVMAPSVIKEADGTYAMFYSGSDGSGAYRIFRADSPDGITWTKRGVVYDATSIHYNAMYSHVYATEAGYTMWYVGGSASQTVYSANSTDGFHFRYVRGEIFPGTPDAPTSVQYPFVIQHGSDYSIFYQGVNTAGSPPRWINHADRAGWSAPLQKDGTVLATPYQGCGRPWVLETAGGYEMFYTRSGADGKWRLNRALSADGLSWQDAGIVVEPTYPYEGAYTGACCVLVDDGEYRMWYTAWDGTNIRICLAELTAADPGLDATATVSFYLDSISDATLVGRVAGVPVPAGETVEVSVPWTAVAGDHDIIAVLSDSSPTDGDPANDFATMTVSVQAAPVLAPAGLEITKVKVSGIDAGITHTYYEWDLLVTIRNTGGSDAVSVVVKDVIPAELELIGCTPSQGFVSTDKPKARLPTPVTGFTTKGAFWCEAPMVDSAYWKTRDIRAGAEPVVPDAAPAPPTLMPVMSTHVTWTVGTLHAGGEATLMLHICTRLNPAGNQEFTSPGLYSLNDGAWASGIDLATGTPLSAGPTAPIYVEVV